MDKWCAQDYKRAAEKHFQACSKLIEVLSNPKQTAHERAIYHEIYYLSGYAVECYLKFGILQATHNTGKLTKQQLDSLGLKTHDLKNLKQKIIECKCSCSRSLVWTSQLNNWSEAVRYEAVPQFSPSYYPDIISHVGNTVTSVRKTILDNY